MSLRHDLTLAAGVAVTAVAEVAVARAVHPQTVNPREAQTAGGADNDLQRGESRPQADGGTVLRLLHDPGFETSQLMFLKMNLVPRRPSPRQRWLPNEVFEVSFGFGYMSARMRGHWC